MTEIKTNKVRAVYAGVVVLVMLIIGGASLVTMTAGASVNDRYLNLESALRGKALEFCELHKEILDEQVRGGVELDIDVADLATVRDNLEVERNCFLHTAAILEGEKQLGKSESEETTK